MAEAIAGELLLLRPSVTKELCDAARVSKVFLLHCILTVVRRSVRVRHGESHMKRPIHSSSLRSKVEGSVQSFQLCWSRVFPREDCALYVAAGFPALLVPSIPSGSLRIVCSCRSRTCPFVLL